MSDHLRFFTSQSPDSSRGHDHSTDAYGPQHARPWMESGVYGSDAHGSDNYASRAEVEMQRLIATDGPTTSWLYPRKSPQKAKSGKTVTTGRGGALQAKLNVGAVNDPLEKEADAVADRVMRNPKDCYLDPPVSPYSQSAQRNPLLGRSGISREYQLPEFSRSRMAPWLRPQQPAGESIARQDVGEQETVQLKSGASEISRMTEPDEEMQNKSLQRNLAGLDDDAKETLGYTHAFEKSDEVEDMGTTTSMYMQRESAASAEGGTVSPELQNRIEGVRNSGGEKLPDSEREFFESRMGHDFGDVRIHTGSEAAQVSRDVNAKAFTIGRDVVFGEGEYKPGTPEGRRLMAHELTHTVQQGAAGEKARREPITTPNVSVDALVEYNQLRIQLLGWLEAPRSYQGLTADWQRMESLYHSLVRAGRIDRFASPFPLETDVRFPELSFLRNLSGTKTMFALLLRSAISSARRRASYLFKNAARDPIKSLYNRVSAQSGATLSDNPFIGVSQDDVEIAYRAWADGRLQKEPWLVLALQKTEGFGGQAAGPVHEGGRIGLPASNSADAVSIFRSQLFYVESGLDHFIDHSYSAETQDNVASFRPGAGAAHDRRFDEGVRQLVRSGYLGHNIKPEINAQLQATRMANGRFRVTIKDRAKYYALVFQLSEAFFRSKESGVRSAIGEPGTPDPRLVYVNWNVRNFNEFVQSAEQHRMEIEYRQANGSAPSISEWAFETRIKGNEYGGPRSNAVRFGYFSSAYSLAYNGW